MDSKIFMIMPFVLYLIGLIMIGMYTYRFTKTMEGFHLGGRTLGPWVAGISICFSGSSGWMFTGCAGMGYIMGPNTWFLMSAFLFDVALFYLLVGKRLRNYSGFLNALTYPEYFVRRVRAKGHGIRIIAALSVLIFMSFYVSSQFIAAGKVLSPMFEITPLTAMFITAITVTVYCLIGGFLAVCWTDFIQGIVIIFGSLALVVYLIMCAGGWGDAMEKLGQIDPNMLTVTDTTWPAFLILFTGAIMGSGRPHDTIRFFALKDSASAREVAVVGEVSLLFNYWTSFMIGYLGRIFFPNLADPESIFSVLCTQFLNPIAGGVMLAAFMALVMSTVDSQLLSAASTLTEDFYHTYINKNASKETLVMWSRICSVLIGVFGLCVAILNFQVRGVMVKMVLFASAGLSATFYPSLLLSLYWKKLTEKGIVASMVTGLVVTLSWAYSGIADVVHIHECFAGFVAAFIVAITVSLHTQQLPQDQLQWEMDLISSDYNEEETNRLATMPYMGGIDSSSWRGGA